MKSDTRMSGRSSFVTSMLAGFFFVLLFCPALASASGMTATPSVIDGKAKQREILRYTVTLENPTNHVIPVYPWVTDLDPTAATDVPKGDLDGSKDKELRQSLARWMEVTRSEIDLLPGDKREIPVLVQVNLNAAPGTYHAVIHFSEGSDRVSAEKNREGTTDVFVNIEVLDDANERLQLGTFVPSEEMFGGDTASFQYRIENIGNRGVVPKGVIRIYDNHGKEVATVDVNKEGTKIEPNTKAQLASTWAAAGQFGKYKAMLDVEYGNHGGLQDTVFFWVLPWGTLLSYFFLIATIAVIMALLFHSYATSHRRTPVFRPVVEEYTDIDPVEEHADEDAVTLASRIRSIVPKFPRWGRNNDEEEDEYEGQYVDEFVEVDIPTRRTVFPAHRGVTEAPTREEVAPRRSRRVSDTHTVTLTHRAKKMEINPDHIVRLGKR